MTHYEFQDLIERADAAGHKAVQEAFVRPMLVGTPRDLGASIVGIAVDGDFDESQPIYYVPDGVCGFAWINCKASATEGRKFLNWLRGSVKSDAPMSEVQPDVLAEPNTDSYYKGVSIWVYGFNQSMQKKEAYGRAFAAELNAAGIDGFTAHCMSRMD